MLSVAATLAVVLMQSSVAEPPPAAGYATVVNGLSLTANGCEGSVTIKYRLLELDQVGGIRSSANATCALTLVYVTTSPELAQIITTTGGTGSATTRLTFDIPYPSPGDAFFDTSAFIEYAAGCPTALAHSGDDGGSPAWTENLYSGTTFGPTVPCTGPTGGWYSWTNGAVQHWLDLSVGGAPPAQPYCDWWYASLGSTPTSPFATQRCEWQKHEPWIELRNERALASVLAGETVTIPVTV